MQHSPNSRSPVPPGAPLRPTRRTGLSRSPTVRGKATHAMLSTSRASSSKNSCFPSLWGPCDPESSAWPEIPAPLGAQQGGEEGDIQRQGGCRHDDQAFYRLPTSWCRGRPRS